MQRRRLTKGGEVPGVPSGCCSESTRGWLFGCASDPERMNEMHALEQKSWVRKGASRLGLQAWGSGQRSPREAWPELGEDGEVGAGREAPAPSRDTFSFPRMPSPNTRETILSKSPQPCTVLTAYDALSLLLPIWPSWLCGGTSLHVTREESGAQRGQAIHSRPHS